MFHNRLGNDPATAAPPLIGALLLASPTLLNGISVDAGVYVTAGQQGRIHLSEGGHVSHYDVKAQLPAPEDARSLLHAGQHLLALEQVAASVGEWGTANPLVPERNDDLAFSPLELLLEERLRHLEQVCSDPLMHLLVEAQRVPTARARKPAVNAVAYLASHTEDWLHPTLRGVRPRRVLSYERDEVLDTYENRIAARLIDELDHHLTQRARNLKPLEQLVARAEHYRSLAQSGGHRRAHRIYALWAQGTDPDAQSQRINAFKGQLAELHHRVRRLKLSPLYRGVPRAAREGVQRVLTLTNVLTNHQHYRWVVRLWEALLREHGPESKERHHEEQQLLLQTFDAFSVLLTLRALEQLGFEPQGGPFARGTTTGLTHPTDRLALAWNLDGTHTLTRADRSLLRVVPLVANLNSLPEAQLRGLLASYPAQPTLAVFLSPSGDAVSHPLLNVAGPEAHDTFPALGIAPWDIESTERVGRALRWAVTGTRLLDYPYTLSETSTIPEPAWVQVRSGTWTVTRPARSHEQSDDPVYGQERSLDDEVRTYQEKLAQASKAQRSSYQRELDRALGRAEQFKPFAREYRRVMRATRALSSCPTCQTPGARFTDREHETFACKCHDCSTQWELRVCSSCRQRYPVLQVSETPLGQQSSGWADRLFGMDVLTLPVQDGHGRLTYPCPFCT